LIHDDFARTHAGEHRMARRPLEVRASREVRDRFPSASFSIVTAVTCDVVSSMS